MEYPDVDKDARVLIDKYRHTLGKHYEKLKTIALHLPRDMDVDEAIASHMSDSEIREVISRLASEHNGEEDLGYLIDILKLAVEHKEDEKSLAALSSILYDLGDAHKDEEAIDLSRRIDFWLDALKTRRKPLIAYLYTIEEGNARPEEEAPQKITRILNRAYYLLEDYSVYPEHADKVDKGFRILKRLNDRFEMYGLGKLFLPREKHYFRVK